MKAEAGKWNDHCNTNSCSIDSGVGARCRLVGVVHGAEWHLGMAVGRPSPGTGVPLGWFVLFPIVSKSSLKIPFS